jgi:stage II sporulation protein D
MARVFYHAHCGGHTESAGVLWRESARPYLRGAPDSSCANAGSAKWSATLTLAELRHALGLAGLDSLEVAARSQSGRVTKLRWSGGLITAGQLHRAVGATFGWGRLMSSLYEVSVHGGEARFDGRGRGHGVGLCQVGAEQRGKVGQSYGEILAAYFPGTRAGATPQGIAWQTARGERVDGELASAADEWVMTEAERAAAEAERRAGMGFASRPRLRVFPTVTTFREATGEPGFVAASTRRRTIRLQPPGRLKAEGRLGPTLLHEMLHALLGQGRTPLWFEEGMVERVAGRACVPAKLGAATEAALARPRTEAAMRAAYANACGAVASLEQKHGRAKLMEWLRVGLEPGAGVE